MDTRTVGVNRITAHVFAIAPDGGRALGCLGVPTNLALFATLVLMQDTLTPAARTKLLEARELVWRSFFANDRAALEKLIPEETIVMDPGSVELGHRRNVFEGAAEFAKRETRLVRLEFPTTEIRSYGKVAIVYSTYLYELEEHGNRTTFTGRITEVFVLRKGHWVNPGWHMEPSR
jgi:hypothetical protein